MRGRVRWGNVGRAVLAVAVVGLVVAWTRLDGGPVEVPSGAVVPVVLDAVAGAAPPVDAGAGRRASAGQDGDAPSVQEPGERARQRGRAVTHAELKAPSPARRRGERKVPSSARARARGRGERQLAPVRGAPEAAVTPAATAVPRAPVAPRPSPADPPAPTRAAPAVPPAPTLDPAEREFGFER
jgi:hypothetical protein